jgi:sec-independent protein translocase protein TatC
MLQKLILALRKLFEFREDRDPEAVKPFLDHLEDLRWMAFKMGITLGIGMMGTFAFHNQLARIMEKPLEQFPAELRKQLLTTRGPAEGFMMALEYSFFAGVIVTFPLLVFFLAQFVLPALTRREKKLVLPVIGVGFVLFVAGLLFCFFLVLPRALGFFFTFNQGMNWTNFWTVREYVSFVTRMELAFGLASELPAVVLALAYFGVLKYEFLRRTRAYAYVITLVIAMFIAPTPDVVTFLSLGVPMCLLYEICIWLALLMERRKSRRAAELPPDS